MKFLCQLLEPINGEVIIFETDQLTGVWAKMYNGAHMVVQPTVAGIYVVERII